MARHLVQRLAFHRPTLLLGLGEGVAGGQRPGVIDGPVGRAFHPAHVRLVDVDAVADEVIGVTVQGAGGVILAGAAADLGDLVLEVGIEQGQPCVQALLTIPQQGDLLAHAGFRFQFWAANQHAVLGATAGGLAPVGGRHAQIR